MIVAIVIGLILALSLSLAALEKLEPTEVGLDYSSFSKKFDKQKLYT